MKKPIESIPDVVQQQRCHGCATCVSACNSKAISLILDEVQGFYYPHIDTAKCNNCTLCDAVCPAINIQVGQAGRELFPSAAFHPLVGAYKNCYVGWSNNTERRKDASSGGLATELLIYLLEHNVVSGAIVTRMSEKAPLRPEVFIATSKDEIIQARGSKYCPVPVNIILQEILAKKKPDARYAYVGLPCHIQGLRRAMKKIPVLDKQVVFCIGLFCSHTPSFKATQTFLQMHGFDKETVTQLSYRGSGWPGGMKINRNTFFSLGTYWSHFSREQFRSYACACCEDVFAELADISLGDAWLNEYRGDQLGTSIFITRTEEIDKIILRMKTEKYITLFPIFSLPKVIISQAGVLLRKKRGFKNAFQLLRAIGPVPFVKRYLLFVISQMKRKR